MSIDGINDVPMCQQNSNHTPTTGLEFTRSFCFLKVLHITSWAFDSLHEIVEYLPASVTELHMRSWSARTEKNGKSPECTAVKTLSLFYYGLNQDAISHEINEVFPRVEDLTLTMSSTISCNNTLFPKIKRSTFNWGDNITTFIGITILGCIDTPFQLKPLVIRERLAAGLVIESLEISMDLGHDFTSELMTSLLSLVQHSSIAELSVHVSDGIPYGFVDMLTAETMPNLWSLDLLLSTDVDITNLGLKVSLLKLRSFTTTLTISGLCEFLKTPGRVLKTLLVDTKNTVSLHESIMDSVFLHAKTLEYLVSMLIISIKKTVFMCFLIWYSC